MDDFKRIRQGYTRARTEREEYSSLWQTISNFVGIKTDINYINDGTKGNKSKQLDQSIDDPTAALSVTQAADYLLGIIWGTGSEAIAIEPSREVLDIGNKQALQSYYDFITEEVLEQVNHAEAGFGSALRCYTTDQVAFGTSGIGAFKNKLFDQGIEGNVIVYKDFGVDSTCINEGKSGLVDYIYVTYYWDAVRIVSEFCCGDNGVDAAKLATMPNKVKQAWDKMDTTTEFVVVFAMTPRENYHPMLKGKRGARYKGTWWFHDEPTSKPFLEEDFATKPIAMARAIKVRGEKYGRSSGTLLISTIRLVNFAVGQAIEVIEKMARPSLGVFGNALFGDAVLDTSPDGMTVFNPDFAGNSGSPVFPMMDVGDPTGLLQWLVPYLNEKIATAFKIDVLLDFSSAKDMTATESLQRFAIRGKSLAGLLGQQKTECLDVILPRSIDLLMQAKRLGVNPEIDKELAEGFAEAKKVERIIPEAVLKIMKQGKPWYKIKYKNELEQLTNTRALESMLQFLQGCGAMAGMFPQIIQSVNWYDLLDNFRESLNIPADMMISKEEFMAGIEADAAMAQAQVASQLGATEATSQKDQAAAQKMSAEAGR
jgi:hypothetical protein